MRLIEGGKPGEGDPVRPKRTGEAGYIVHVFSVHPFEVTSSWWCWWRDEGSFAPSGRWRRRRLR